MDSLPGRIRLRHPYVVHAAAVAALVAAVAPAHADVAGSAAAYTQAFNHFEAGDLRAARVELLNALKANPNNANARLLLARVLLARGAGVAAQAEIDRAIKAGVPREKTYHLTANALLLDGKASQALAMARDPRIPPQFGAYAARMRGRAQITLGSTAEGGRSIEEAVRLAPNNVEALVDLARYQAGSRDIPAAERSVDRALAIKPGNVDALNLKGGIVRATKGLPQSLAFYDRALKSDANSIETLLERAATLSDLGRLDAARTDIKEVMGLIPNHPIVLYLSAAIAAREGKFQDAQTLLGQTKGLLDKYPPAQFLRARLAMQQKNLGVAVETLSALVAEQPANPIARRMLALVQLQRGDPRGALASLEPLAKQTDLDAQTLAMFGQAYAQTGDFSSAQGFYQRAAKLAPNLPQLDTQIAMTRLAQGDPAGAIAGLNGVLKTDPKSLQALMSLTYVQLRLRDYRAAAVTAERLIAAHPDLPVSYNLHGTAALGMGDTKRAEADFRAALAKDPKFLDARRNLAQLFLVTNRADAGKAELRSIVAGEPSDVRSLMLLADVAGQAKAWPERLDWLRRAVLVNPRDPQPRAALVQTYVAAGNPGQALTEAAAIARERPTDPAALQLLAGAQAANKQNDAALATLKQLVAVAPTAPGARLLLARFQATVGGPSGLSDARATLEGMAKLGGKATEQAYVSLIQLEMSAKNPDAALAVAARLRAVTPQKVAVDKMVGDINLAAGRGPAALAAYEHVRASADNAQVAVLIARAQAAMGQRDAGMKTLQDYRAKHPKDLMASVAVADMAITRKDWRGAIDTYLSMKNTPAAGSAAVLNNLAFAYNEIGDPRAVAAAARANQIAPGQPTIEDTYGWVLTKNGRDPKHALALLQAAAKAAPGDPNIRYHLGMAYKANGMKSEAARELKAAIATPGLDDAVPARQALAAVGG